MMVTLHNRAMIQFSFLTFLRDVRENQVPDEPPQPPILGASEIYVPPELGARGRFARSVERWDVI